MPKLPDRQSLVQSAPRPNTAVIRGPDPIAERAGAQLGGAIADAGFAVMDYSRRAQDRKEALAATDAASTAAVETIKLERELENDNDYATMESRYREKLTKLHGDLLTGVNDPVRRANLQGQLNVDLERGISRVQGVARRKEIDTSVAALNSLIAQNRESALIAGDEVARSGLIKSTLDAIQVRQDAGHINAQQAEQIRQKATLDYAIGAADMLTPEETIAKLSGDTSNTIYDYIPSDTKYKLVEQARTKIKQNAAILRTGLSEQLNDATAAYLQGLKYDNPPTEADFLAAYPEDGAKRYQEFAKTQSLGDTLAAVAVASPEDRRAILERNNPVQDVVSAGFANDSKRFGILVNSVQALEKELAADPAAYAIKHSDPVRKAFESLQQDPASVEQYATIMKAEQERLGAPTLNLLPESQARSIAARFNDDKGENAAVMIESMANDWGKHWPTVYRQLSKDLPPAALIIGSGVDPSTAETLARTANLKTEDLKAGLIKSDVTEANNLVSETFADFRQTMSLQGNEALYSKLEEQAKRLTYTYMGQGASYGDAVNKAYKSLVEDKYSLNETYRVPVEYDAGAVDDGAQAVLDEIDTGAVKVYGGQELPKEFIDQRVRQRIVDQGVWVTSQDESGLVLTYNGSVLADDAGRPLFYYSFDDLVGRGAGKRVRDDARIQQDIRERR